MVPRSTWYKRGAKYHVLRYDPDFDTREQTEEEELVRPVELIENMLKATEGCNFKFHDVVKHIKGKQYKFMGKKYSICNLNERLNLYYAICCAFHLTPIKIMTVKEYADYLKERKGLK